MIAAAVAAIQGGENQYPPLPDDDVVVLEPYSDSYAACIEFAGARRRCVTLRRPPVHLERLRDALREATRSLLRQV